MHDVNARFPDNFVVWIDEEQIFSYVTRFANQSIIDLGPEYTWCFTPTCLTGALFAKENIANRETSVCDSVTRAVLRLVWPFDGIVQK